MHLNGSLFSMKVGYSDITDIHTLNYSDLTQETIDAITQLYNQAK